MNCVKCWTTIPRKGNAKYCNSCRKMVYIEWREQYKKRMARFTRRMIIPCEVKWDKTKLYTVIPQNYRLKHITFAQTYKTEKEAQKDIDRWNVIFQI
jgi:hypothetical protein